MRVLGFFDSLLSSVDNFGFLVGVLDGRSVDFYTVEGHRKMLCCSMF